MSQKTLLQFIIEYLIMQKTYGRKSVRRTSIYSVVEFKFGIDSIFNGKAITQDILIEAAEAAGGEYVPSKGGKSKIVFA